MSESSVDAVRLLAWIRETPRRPAAAAFTAGAERQIAYWIEIAEQDRLDRNKIKWLRNELRHAETKVKDYDSYGSEAAAVRSEGKAGKLRREIDQLERATASRGARAEPGEREGET